MIFKGVLLASLLCFALGSLAANAPSPRPADSYRVVHVFPHDPRAFTQGLVYVRCEGSGL